MSVWDDLEEPVQAAPVTLRGGVFGGQAQGQASAPMRGDLYHVDYESGRKPERIKDQQPFGQGSPSHMPVYTGGEDRKYGLVDKEDLVPYLRATTAINREKQAMMMQAYRQRMALGAGRGGPPGEVELGHLTYDQEQANRARVLAEIKLDRELRIQKSINDAREIGLRYGQDNYGGPGSTDGMSFGRRRPQPSYGMYEYTRK